MYDTKLRKQLTTLAHQYGLMFKQDTYLHPVANTANAVIFCDLEFNFHPLSWKAINNNEILNKRTQKVHSHFEGNLDILELQSSNSSDALAMSVFCHPKIKTWKGISNLFEIDVLKEIEFGYKAKIHKVVNQQIVEDSTEVDVLINKNIVCECKLTEEGFTEKEIIIVESYKEFGNVFHTEMLKKNKLNYINYQLIRNILAANQIQGRFFLICDMRRPDLAKKFYQTIRCIKDEYKTLRNNCEIIYWQEIANASGKDLKDFLALKYGI